MRSHHRREAYRAAIQLHFTELLQGPVDDDGLTVVGLITLPMNGSYAVAVFSPRQGDEDGIAVRPADKSKSLQAVRTVVNAFSLGASGLVSLEPMSEGSAPSPSTADVLACITAVTNAKGISLSPEVLQIFAWSVERATDPLLLGPVLYASREGRVLERYTDIPGFRCIGFHLGDRVDTNTLAEKQARNGFSLDHIAGFRVVLAMLRRGVAVFDRALIARAATLSGTLNLDEEARYGLVPEKAEKWPDLVAMIDNDPVLGVSTSHSGNACALLLDPSAGPAEIARVEAELSSLLNIAPSDLVHFSAEWR